MVAVPINSEMHSYTEVFDKVPSRENKGTIYDSLQGIKRTEHPAFHDLKTKGYGRSISGGKFSTIYGDLITELFNKETKGIAGPFRSGFSKNLSTK